MFSLVIDDISLLEKIKSGSPVAYEVLYNKYFNALCVFVQSYTHNLSKAEDIVQQVMLRIWENKTDIKIGTSFKSYLYRACYNEFINYYKRSQKTSFLDDIVIEAYEELYDDEWEFEKKLQLVKEEIQKLPPKCREVFTLCKLKGYKYKEAAAALNISEKTVEVQISNAMKRLKKSFEN